MGKLAGVASVAFDCKLATVRMAGDATLQEKEVRAAIESLGYKPGTFSAQEPPTLPVLLARVAATAASAPASAAPSPSFDAAALARIEAAVARAVALPSSLESGSDGRVFVRLASESKLDVAAIEARLRRELREQRIELVELTAARWRTTTTRYAVKLRSADGGAALAALAALPQVCGVLRHADGASFTLFTREPCANLAARVRETLLEQRLELASIEAAPAPVEERR